jgi:multicomponent Na+:H+ antiporter subunit E
MGTIKKLTGYTLWLLYEIAKSGIAVTKLIWQKHLSVAPVVSWVPTVLQNDVARVVYANSITLTPGTITICVENERLLVHSLTTAGIEILQTGAMDNRIKSTIC